MKHYLFASHGHFAKELVSTIKMIIGGDHSLRSVSLEPHTSVQQLEGEIDEFLQLGNMDQDQYFILTDVLGGSVTNTCNKKVGKKNVYIITGMNLPLALELLNAPASLDVRESINNCIEQGKNGIIFVNQMIEEHANS
ncbi:hypothetical protein SFC23_17875 [Shouchella clausii]|uniref:PTS sugar transporter subunit IIA n=1 Tax=Shouchella clausii TaxID=79880 RepID=UPI003982E502